MSSSCFMFPNCPRNVFLHSNCSNQDPSAMHSLHLSNMSLKYRHQPLGFFLPFSCWRNQVLWLVKFPTFSFWQLTSWWYLMVHLSSILVGRSRGLIICNVYVCLFDKTVCVLSCHIRKHIMSSCPTFSGDKVDHRIQVKGYCSQYSFWCSNFSIFGQWEPLRSIPMLFVI